MPREMIIDDGFINDDSDCYVIVEAGHNHQGNLETCMEVKKKWFYLKILNPWNKSC